MFGAVFTGTVVSGATDWLSRHDARELTAVAIGPDLGERYLDTIYQASWLRDLYGDDVLNSEEIAADLGALPHATDTVAGRTTSRTASATRANAPQLQDRKS